MGYVFKKTKINSTFLSCMVSAVNEGSVQNNLLGLIQELGEYLINDDEFIRAKGNYRLDPPPF